jgi:hypothetical protein
MSIDNFKKIISTRDPEDIVKECLFRRFTHVIPKETDYSAYIGLISYDYRHAEHIAIMGSGNWGYSLNPEKKLRPFCDDSDIDVVIICYKTFLETWNELRNYHRKNYYLLNQIQRKTIKRNGENVYSGFISPKWIFDRRSPVRFAYEINSDRYANQHVKYRTVNMMYFKNHEEAVDYYVRGFRLAKEAIKDGI